MQYDLSKSRTVYNLVHGLIKGAISWQRLKQKLMKHNVVCLLSNYWPQICFSECFSLVEREHLWSPASRHYLFWASLFSVAPYAGSSQQIVKSWRWPLPAMLIPANTETFVVFNYQRVGFHTNSYQNNQTRYFSSFITNKLFWRCSSLSSFIFHFIII